MKSTELLAILDREGKNIDAGGSLSFFQRNLRRAFGLRGRYLRYLLLRSYPGLRRNRVLKGKTAWGRSFVMPAEDLYGISLASFGILTGSDVRVAKYIAKHLKEDDVFYDVGANYGFYSMLAEALLSRGEVHLFEPVTQVFSYLKKNFENESSGQRIFLNQAAVADTVGQGAFYESYSSAVSGNSTLREDVSRAEAGAFRTVQVAITTLDEYGKTHRPPALMKMDIEGAEFKALTGAKKMLVAHYPAIVMEMWLMPPMNAEHLRAAEFLFGLGYAAYALDDNGEISKIGDLAEHLRAAAEGGALNGNFVFQAPSGVLS